MDMTEARNTIRDMINGDMLSQDDLEELEEFLTQQMADEDHRQSILEDLKEDNGAIGALAAAVAELDTQLVKMKGGAAGATASTLATLGVELSQLTEKLARLDSKVTASEVHLEAQQISERVARLELCCGVIGKQAPEKLMEVCYSCGGHGGDHAASCTREEDVAQAVESDVDTQAAWERAYRKLAQGVVDARHKLHPYQRDDALEKLIQDHDLVTYLDESKPPVTPPLPKRLRP